MKVLLDIDGVMVTANSWRAPRLQQDGFYSFNLKALENLNHIVNSTGATILLTTSHKSRFSQKKWAELFRERGIRTSVEKLASNSLKVGRKNEVLKWVSAHPNEKFVIIDDDKSLNDLPSDVKDKLVLTSSSIGLTKELASSAIEILSR